MSKPQNRGTPAPYRGGSYFQPKPIVAKLGFGPRIACFPTTTTFFFFFIFII